MGKNQCANYNKTEIDVGRLIKTYIFVGQVDKNMNNHIERKEFYIG